MKFSVIIPCRSMCDFLRENISHLKQLTYKDFEVLIVLDKLEEVDFGGDPRFKIISAGPIGPGEKRNFGVQHATGDVVVFLDDDAYPKQDWLNRAAEIFEREDIYALGAPAVTPLNAPFLERCSGYVLESMLSSFSTIYRHTPMARRFVDDYPTVNLFVKKEAFDSVGGFIKDFWPGEDTKLCLDLINKFKKPFLYDPAPIVYHHRRTLFKSHLKQVSRYGMHRGYFCKIFPGNSLKLDLPYFIPALFIFGLIVGPIISFLIKPLWYFYFFCLSLYFGLLFVEVIRFSLKDKSVKTGIFVGVGIFLTHFIYGVNFMLGLFKKPKLKLKKIDLVTGNYSEG